MRQPLRRKPVQIQRVLIAHHLLLGDTLLLTPLIAKLREQLPNAQITLICPKPIVSLYANRPFGINTIPFDPRNLATVLEVLRSGPYDLGIVAGDNRYSWLALATNCRWIVAHENDAPHWKNWPVDEVVPYPATPAAWADLATELIPGAPPRRYLLTDWPAPCRSTRLDAALLKRPYVVLHPGASTSVKRWPNMRWRELAQWVTARGYIPVWSGGPGEDGLIREIGPSQDHPNFAGKLRLDELWHLFAGAQAVVCPDTGVAHLARLIGVPAVVLFGPGSASCHGAGEYWRDVPFVPVTVTDMPCRNEPFIFRRKLDWIRRCDRNQKTCIAWHGDHADCMGRLSVTNVSDALQNILAEV